MKNFSIKILMLVLVTATIVMSCKKLDGPVPDTKVLLSSKTWVATSATANGVPFAISGCNGLSFQFANSGLAYQGDGPVATCGTPALAGTWTINDQVVTVAGGFIFTVNSISATNMQITTTGSPLFVIQMEAQ
jgi:hypothetical protein